MENEDTLPAPAEEGGRYSDRFIPSRTGSNLAGFMHDFGEADGGSLAEREDTSQAYTALLRSSLSPVAAPPALSPGRLGALERAGVLRRANTGGSPATKNLLRFLSDPSGSSPPLDAALGLPARLGEEFGDALGLARKPARKIARSPFKVLDAPHLTDDFYLNLVDWSASNVLAVGLGPCVYLWSAVTAAVTKLVDLGPPGGDTVTSVAWSNRGGYLSVGTSTGEVQLWDAPGSRLVRTLRAHRGRVGTLAWCGSTLATGSRDRQLLHCDVRAPEEVTARLTGHRSELCGLRWSPDGRMLASGGNDNALLIWCARSAAASNVPLLRFTQHTAAVKALSWSPHAHGLLASGGGTADKCIRIWNTASGAELECVQTGSQVCNVAWSANCDEIVSTHGYSLNQVVVWRYPSMAKVATLTGHTMRVLYLAVSPDGTTIVTGAGDETLRFWQVFPGASCGAAAESTSPLVLGRAAIR